MTVGRSRLYPCSSGPPALETGVNLYGRPNQPSKRRTDTSAPVWSQKARPDVQTSIRPGLKSSCSVIRIDAARYYSASLRLQQIFDAAAKRAGQSEHGGDGSFAKVFAALLVHLDGAQGNAGAAGQPDWLSPARTRIVCSRSRPRCDYGRPARRTRRRIGFRRLRAESGAVARYRRATAHRECPRTALPWPIGSMRVPIRPSIRVLSRRAVRLAAYRECAPNRFAA